MGMVKLMEESDLGETDNNQYTFTIAGAADELSALSNVKIVTDLSKRYSTKDILFYFQKIGIDATDQKPVSTYSSGMKRRVAILRALLADADFILMDEPLKGLDEETKDDVIALILLLTKGKTFLMTTHDRTEAEKLHAKTVNLTAY